MKMPRKTRRVDNNDRRTARLDWLDQWWVGRDRGGERVLGSLGRRERAPSDRGGDPKSKAKARKP